MGRIMKEHKRCRNARDAGQLATTGRDECPPRRGHVVLWSVLCTLTMLLLGSLPAAINQQSMRLALLGPKPDGQNSQGEGGEFPEVGFEHAGESTAPLHQASSHAGARGFGPANRL